jgi:hypothetical protein
MPYQSTQSQCFRDTIHDWITQDGEILAIIRFSHAAGAKSFEFYTDGVSLYTRLDKLPPKTCVVIVKEPAFPLRGKVDDKFINEAKSMIDDGEEYQIIGLELTKIGKASWYHEASGDQASELHEHLESVRDEIIAFGKVPNWLHDSDTIISAVVPEPDGTVICGVY